MCGRMNTRSGLTDSSCWATTARAARTAAAGDRTDAALGRDSDRKPWEVPRPLLTGKAFYVYWPHGVPFWPDIALSMISAFRSGLISNG